jgi:purine nucleoside phosphorylase
MVIGVITGSGTYSLPGFEDASAVTVPTPFGPVACSRGGFGGVEVVHIARHGAGHPRLSSGVNHRANLWALRELSAEAVVGCTVCGAVDPTLDLGSLVVFDDLHFISNRLPDGSLCTLFTEEGDPARGHWILHGGPYSLEVRAALLGAGAALTGSGAFAGRGMRDGGVYGHVDGPRFNTPAEIAQLAAAGVVAVSQTGGPETVLAGELELPFALLGFITDYANEVIRGEPTPVATLVELMRSSPAVFTEVLREALPRIAAGTPAAAGTMFRIEG